MATIQTWDGTARTELAATTARCRLGGDAVAFACAAIVHGYIDRRALFGPLLDRLRCAGSEASNICDGAGGASLGDVPATTPCTVVPQGGCPPDHTCVFADSEGDTTCYGAGTLPTASACVAAKVETKFSNLLLAFLQ